MTNLAATYQDAVEVSALARARELVARFNKGTPWSPHSAFSPEASSALSSYLLNFLLDSVQGRMMLIAAAKAGDPDMVDLLRSVIIEAKSKQIDMPLEIKEYDLWKDVFGEQRKRRTEKRDYNSRNLHVAIIVAVLVDEFPTLLATGRSARRRSACSIVGEALFEVEVTKANKTVHLQRSYETVKKVWDRLGHVIMPDVRGWPK